MTQEEKQLLLKDLCARLPYGVKLKDYQKLGEYALLKQIDFYRKQIAVKTGIGSFESIPFYKLEWNLPYLRPMSSMTEEECKELGGLSAIIENVGETLPNVPYYVEVARPEQIDWLNAHHFDYRGLIEKGLALEAPERMYKTE